MYAKSAPFTLPPELFGYLRRPRLSLRVAPLWAMHLVVLPLPPRQFPFPFRDVPAMLARPVHVFAPSYTELAASTYALSGPCLQTRDRVLDRPRFL